LEKVDIFKDIAERTGGDVYLGVVGAVRTGKSTFIKRFMETVVLPNITNEADRIRAIDELPQSAAGRTIMTTEPKLPPLSVELRTTPAAAAKIGVPDGAIMSRPLWPGRFGGRKRLKLSVVKFVTGQRTSPEPGAVIDRLTDATLPRAAAIERARAAAASSAFFLSISSCVVAL